ncbi:unnamed protein product, partial [marine sediment metagenome]
MNSSVKPNAGGWFASLYAVVLILIGLILFAGGAMLVGLGGSWYYLIAGALLVVSGRADLSAQFRRHLA